MAADEALTDDPFGGRHPTAFDPGDGWKVAAIEPDRVETRFHDDGAPAWFATIERI